LLVPGNSVELVPKLLIILYVDETCPRIDRSPFIRVVRAQLPCACAAHGKAAHDQAAFIDRVMLYDVLQRFKYIELTCEFERIHETSVRVQNDCIQRS